MYAFESNADIGQARFCIAPKKLIDELQFSPLDAMSRFALKGSLVCIKRSIAIALSDLYHRLVRTYR
jgi:hypothetical protein